MNFNFHLILVGVTHIEGQQDLSEHCRTRYKRSIIVLISIYLAQKRDGLLNRAETRKDLDTGF